MKEFDEFARMGATPKELKRLPRHDLGLGVFSIALAALGENYAQEYKRHIGEEKLKKIKNLDEFLDVFLALNDKLARMSEDERLNREALVAKPSFKDIATKVSKKPSEDVETETRMRQYLSSRKKLFVVNAGEAGSDNHLASPEDSEEAQESTLHFDEIHQEFEDMSEYESQYYYAGKLRLGLG